MGLWTQCKLKMALTIINRKAAPRPFGDRVLSHREEKSLREREEYLEKVLDRGEIRQGLTYDVQDEASVKQDLARTKRILQTQTVGKIGKEERKRLEVEERQLKERLQTGWEGVPGMPTWAQYQVHPREGISYANMRDTIVKWEQSRLRNRLVRRWKDIRRMLYTDDASTADTRHLFRK